MWKNEAYPLAFIQADINGTAELDVSALRELESAEFRRQEVAVHGVEVFEQVRIDGAPVCGICVRVMVLRIINHAKHQEIPVNANATTSSSSISYPLIIIVSSCVLVSVTSM